MDAPPQKYTHFGHSTLTECTYVVADCVTAHIYPCIVTFSAFSKFYFQPHTTESHAIFTLNHEFSKFKVQRNWSCDKIKENITSIVTNILYLLHIQHFIPNCVFFQSILY